MDETTTETNRTGKVKWYDPGKKYGFVVLDGDGEEAMLHISSLRALKIDKVSPESVVECVTEIYAGRLRIKRLISLTLPNNHKVEPTPPDSEFVDARVKWFNTANGYGFVSRGANTPDIFVHAEVLKLSGMVELLPGSAVKVALKEGPKGLCASHVRAA